MAKALQRIQELFRQGTVVRLGDDITLWVKKLNALEKDEAVKDGRQARALRMIAFDRSEDEQAQIGLAVEEMSNDDLQRMLLDRSAGELLLKADEEVRADEKWRERLDAIERSGLMQSTRRSEQEDRTLAELLVEFQEAVNKEHRLLMRQELQDLKKKSREELQSAFRAAWRERLGIDAYHASKEQSEIWMSLYECTVQFDEDGDPDLKTLKVGEQVCADRAEVLTLPDEVLLQVRAALANEMTARDAGNSDAPSASSGSSGQRSEEADSNPSTPTEM